MTEIPDWWKSYAADHPRWEAWRGIDMLFHARVKGATPPVMVRGEDAEDLADMIRAWEGTHS